MSEENTLDQSLPVSVKDLNELPENQRPYYEEKDGIFYRSVTPTSEVKKLKEQVSERSKNNDVLNRQLSQFGETPEERVQALQLLEKVKKEKIEKESKKVDKNETLDSAVVSELREQIDILRKENEEAKKAAQEKEHTHTISDAVSKLRGLKPKFKDTIMGQAKSNFKLENGQLVPVSENGQNWDEYAGAIRKDYPEFFDKVVGTDSPGNQEPESRTKEEKIPPELSGNPTDEEVEEMRNFVLGRTNAPKTVQRLR